MISHGATISPLGTTPQAVPATVRERESRRAMLNSIRVVLAEANDGCRQQLGSILKTASDIVLAGEAITIGETVALVLSIKPNVVVMERPVRIDSVATISGAINEMGRECSVIIMSTHDSDDDHRAFTAAGAAGHFIKEFADRELVDAVRTVARGDLYVGARPPHVVTRHDANMLDETTRRVQFDRLTARERDVLLLVGQGYSAAEIGAQLFISPKTVDSYKQRIHDKVGLCHRADYVQFALSLGLLRKI